MNRKITIALCSILLMMSGCSKKTEKNSSATAKPKKTAVTSESPEASESAEPTSESTAPAKTAAPVQNNGGTQTAPAQNNNTNTAAAAVTTPEGTWQIISYDNGSGNVQTFTPGKDSSIIGSSSIVLNQNGSCEFNLPGMNSDGCTWSGTNISTNGTQVTYSLSGNQMTVKSADGTYVFQKAQ